MTKVRIMIVEDEGIVAIDLRNRLRRLGYDVPAMVVSGEDAIAKARELIPDLVLMDIQLKGEIDGIEAAKQIRTAFNIPAIYLTAYADEATLERAKITEPYGYLIKPFEERDLRTTIEMALYKHKMEQKLQESERWLAATLQSIGDAVVATDVQGRIQFLNPVAEALTGQKREVVLGQELDDVFHIISENDDRHEKSGQLIKNPITKTIQESIVIHLPDKILLTKGGLKQPIDCSTAPIKDETRKVVGAVLVFRDISERKQAEEILRDQNHKLALLNRIITASVSASDPTTILAIVCRELAQILRMPRAIAALLSEDKTNAMVVTTYPATQQAALLNMVIAIKDIAQIQYLLTNDAPFAITDVQNDPRLAQFHELLRQRNTTTLFFLPLMVNGEIAGCLILASSEMRYFLKEEMSLAKSVADQLAGALARTQLDKERQRLSMAIEQSVEAVIITDTQGIILYVNPAFERVTGYKCDETIGQPLFFLKADASEQTVPQDLWATISSGRGWQGRITDQKKDGTPFTTDTTISPVRDDQDRITNYVVVSHDLTEALKLEAQYHQAQKMQTIGVLTGGIAHDFNNLLTAINGFAELIQIRLPSDSTLQRYVDNILKSGHRAVDLINQLLAFSRKQIIKPSVLDLNNNVLEMDKMLRRIIGEHIQMEIKLEPDLWPVKADATQIEQIIVNLAVNARDAMPDGGRLTIETANLVLDETSIAGELDIQPGQYAMLAVSDTGIGMNEMVKANLFDPFFTTKEIGLGTGLGLATVYGIVKQNKGVIWVDSEEGYGTCFKICLPRTTEMTIPQSQDNFSNDMPQGTEGVLVAEDNSAVREMVVLTLQRQGYQVIEAIDGREALHLWEENMEKIELLLTDVVMPGMNGKDLADQLLQSQPDMKILFMSGYTDNTITHHSVLNPETPFLQKPFSPQVLIRKVREILDGQTT